MQRLTENSGHGTRSGDDGWKTDRVFLAAAPAKDTFRCVLVASHECLLLIELRGSACRGQCLPTVANPGGEDCSDARRLGRRRARSRHDRGSWGRGLRGSASECPHRRACWGGCIGEALDQSSGSDSATKSRKGFWEKYVSSTYRSG